MKIRKFSVTISGGKKKTKNQELRPLGSQLTTNDVRDSDEEEFERPTASGMGTKKRNGASELYFGEGDVISDESDEEQDVQSSCSSSDD